MLNHPLSPLTHLSKNALRTALAGMTVLISACSTTPKGTFMGSQPAASARDATRQNTAAHARNGIQAPNQIQVPLRTSTANADPLIPIVQTYLGTLPCLGNNMQCDVQRMTITLAPNGIWRSRSVFISQQGAQPAEQTLSEQGCWQATNERPARIRLIDGNNQIRLNLSTSANNNTALLRVLAISGQTPATTFTFARQPDVDPIDDLSAAPIPNCNPPS